MAYSLMPGSSGTRSDGTSPLSSSGGVNSLSPPESAVSLDFSLPSMAPSPQEDIVDWQATLAQLMKNDAIRNAALANGQHHNPTKGLPYSFGSARFPSALETPTPPNFAEASVYDYDESSVLDLFGGISPNSSLMCDYSKASLLEVPVNTPAPNVSPAALTAQSAEAQVFAMGGIDRRALYGTPQPSTLLGFEPSVVDRAKRPALVQQSDATVQPTFLVGNAAKPFKAKIPDAYITAGPSITIEAGEPAEGGKSAGEKRKSPTQDEGDGHNAVERRYRTKINAYIVGLQSLVPALAHLVDPPDMQQTHRRKTSAFVLSSQPSIPAGTVIDGVPAAAKLSKGVVLGKSLDYLRHLRRERERLQKERSITRSVLEELVDGSDYIMSEVQRRYQEATVELEARYKQEDQAWEIESTQGTAARPRKAAKMMTSSKTGKRNRKAASADSDESDEDDDSDDRHQYLSASSYGQQMRYPPSQHSSPDDVTSQGPPRAALAVFAGVSFVGGLGYDHFNASGSDTASASSAWAPREFVKRALVAGDRESMPNATGNTPAPSNALLFLGTASLIGWVLYLAWPLMCAMVGRRRSVSHRRRQAALQILSVPAKPRESELTRARRIREALTVLAGTPTTTIGASFALVWDAALGAIGFKARGFRNATNEADKVEIALALMRLAELESAKGAALCSLPQRLYTFVRLHNLLHSPRWPHQSSPALAIARGDATLALCLTSIFGSQASALSRRRRLWRNAVAEPKRLDDAEQIEPWVAAALGAEYDEATAVQRRGAICGALPSPSDTLPLLRVAEARCETALLEVWTLLFGAVMRSTCRSMAPLAPIPELELRIDHILKATVPGSPLRTMSVLTSGVVQLGKGDMAASRDLALRLALEARDGGPAGGLASVSAFARLLLGDAVGLFMHAGEPAGQLDTLAAASVRWLIIRQCANKASEDTTKIDRDLHEATRALRSLLGQDIFRRDGLADAQMACVDALERLGRKAAGLHDLDGSDSGFEEGDA